MKITCGAGNEIVQNLEAVFGETRVSVGRIVDHYADLLGFDPAAIEIHNDGTIVGRDAMASDASVLVIQPKANTKG